MTVFWHPFRLIALGRFLCRPPTGQKVPAHLPSARAGNWPANSALFRPSSTSPGFRERNPLPHAARRLPETRQLRFASCRRETQRKLRPQCRLGTRPVPPPAESAPSQNPFPDARRDLPDPGPPPRFSPKPFPTLSRQDSDSFPTPHGTGKTIQSALRSTEPRRARCSACHPTPSIIRQASQAGRGPGRRLRYEKREDH